MPEWACGAILLVPMTAEQVAEAGLALKAHHVVALESDRDCVAEALQGVPCRRRPVVKAEHQADVGSPGGHGSELVVRSNCGPHLARADLGAVQGTASVFEELGVVVEHTFLHLRAASANFEISEESTVVQTVASQQRSYPSAARQEMN